MWMTAVGIGVVCGVVAVAFATACCAAAGRADAALCEEARRRRAYCDRDGQR